MKGWLCNRFQRAAHEQGNLKRMAERRRDYLREGGTKRARRVGGRVRLHLQAAVDGTGEVTDLVNQSTLLCSEQQQQEAQYFERVSHQVGVDHQLNRGS